VYQLILSMLSDKMFQLFFFLKTSHTPHTHPLAFNGLL
jgi:hypothetical protein